MDVLKSDDTLNSLDQYLMFADGLSNLRRSKSEKQTFLYFVANPKKKAASQKVF
jgi:hypothetical protein